MKPKEELLNAGVGVRKRYDHLVAITKLMLLGQGLEHEEIYFATLRIKFDREIRNSFLCYIFFRNLQP